MRFIIDEQLPRRLCRWLQARGHLAVHVLDQNFGGDDDRQIVAYATTRELIVITKDADFPELQRNEQPRIVWLRCGNMINSALIAMFERKRTEAEAKLSRGDCLIELY